MTRRVSILRISASTYGNDDLEEIVKGHLERDLVHILKVLKHSGRDDELATLIQQAESDLKSRGLSELMAKVKKKVFVT